MLRIILAALAAGIAMFIWGWISWMAIPWHENTMHGLPQEDAAIAALKQNVTDSGVYLFPYYEGTAMEGAEWDAFVAKHKAGPRGMIFYLSEGAEPMPPICFARGFALNVAAALVAAILLAMAGGGCKCYGRRVLFVTLIGVAATIMTHLTMLNWMPVLRDYALVNAADTVVTFLVAGLVIAAIVKPKAPRTPADEPAAGESAGVAPG